jgi:hypothetical protein
MPIRGGVGLSKQHLQVVRVLESSDNGEQRIVPMEPGLHEAVAILHTQLFELHVVWAQYRQLYADAGTVEVLNRTSGLFFKIVQDKLWDSVLLGICRMLDPAFGRGGRDKNLTLYSLLLLINDVALKSEFEQACNNAVISAKFAKDHRDKRIAHQDHGYATNPALVEASAGSRQDVETALFAIRGIMQLVQRHYNDADVLYDNTRGFISGAEKLVAALRQLEQLKSTDGKGN